MCAPERARTRSMTHRPHQKGVTVACWTASSARVSGGMVLDRAAAPSRALSFSAFRLLPSYIPANRGALQCHRHPLSKLGECVQSK